MRYRELYNNIPIGIIELDGDGFIVSVNKTLLDWLGYSREEIIGKRHEEILTGEGRERFRKAMERCWRGEFVEDAELEFRRRDGSPFPARIDARPIFDGQGRIIGLWETIRDARRERELERELIQAQRMEAVGLLAGGIAHDFNNLLTVIIGNAELGLKEVKQSDPLHLSLSQIKEAVQKAMVLTRQLLTFSRHKVLQRTAVDVAALLDNLSEMLARIIGEDIELRLNVAPNIGNIYADPAALEQILMNLVVNARDAMPQGGILTIRAQNVRLDEQLCYRYPDARPGDYVQISVEDTGIGMDEETLRKAFEPFFTTKEGGTGLGLSIVREMVKQHEGFIMVSSRPGQGTKFEIWFPLYRGVMRRDAKGIQGDIPYGSETILVAEDEDNICELLKVFFETLGYTVLPARDGEEALRVFAENQGRIDLVVLDVVMPKLGGFKAYERISAMCPDLPCLFITGYDEWAIWGYLEQIPEEFLIYKPIDFRELGQKVRELLDKGKRSRCRNSMI